MQVRVWTGDQAEDEGDISRKILIMARFLSLKILMAVTGTKTNTPLRARPRAVVCRSLTVR